MMDCCSRTAVPSSIAVCSEDRRLFLTAQRNAKIDSPGPNELNSIGCIAAIVQHLKLPNGHVKLLVEGRARARVLEIDETGDGYFRAVLKEIDREAELTPEVKQSMARTAGLFDARLQVEYIESHKLMFLGSGLTDPDVSLAASLVLYGAFHLKYPAALNGPQFLAGSFLKNPLQQKDGTLQVPTGPGLGVEIDEGRVRDASAG